MAEPEASGGHAFISYAREDAKKVDRLERALVNAGIAVWRDTSELWPGDDWKLAIRGAIEHDAFAFIACFSKSAVERKGYHWEELNFAVEQYRQQPPDRPWLFPVRFDNCDIPRLDLSPGKTLRDLQRVDLFGRRSDASVRRLVHGIRRVLPAWAPGEAVPSTRRSPDARDTYRDPPARLRPRSWFLPSARRVSWRGRLLLLAIAVLAAGLAATFIINRGSSRAAETTPVAPPTTIALPPPPPSGVSLTKILRPADRLVFAQSQERESQLYVVTRKAVTRVTRGHYDTEPALSPDKRWIAFARKHGKDLDKSNIYLISIDGGEPKQLTASNDASGPTWSRDGSRIIFAGPEGNLWSMSARGHKFQLVKESDWETLIQPALSADGKRIAYVQQAFLSDKGRAYVMNANGTEARPLTKQNEVQSAPAWSPDGTLIAYVHGPAGVISDIFVADVKEAKVRRALTDDDIVDVSPTWSPRGDWIAFQRKLRKGTYAVFVMKVSGSSVPQRTPLTSKAWGERVLDWG